MTLHVTEWEHQVLQALASYTSLVGAHPHWGQIQFEGMHLFDLKAWNASISEARPLISMALGRLQKKGLVLRHDNYLLSPNRPTWGRWELTELGKELMGVPA